MEEGSLRCDANVSVMEKGSKVFGTRSEIKNMNSFKSLEKATEIIGDAKSTSNWLMGDISKIMKENDAMVEDLKFTAEHLAELIKLINDGTISNNIGKKVIIDMFNTGISPKTIINEKGLIQNSDEGDILEIVNKVLDSNTKSIEDYKNGKTRAISFLVGMVMKETKGKANPQIVNKLINEEIKKC